MDNGRALHTLDELTGLVEAALSVDYRGAPTGRVRDVPDQRAIRWYVTRGLVDRPAAMRGRVALYGHRHLLQLVAIKRRQEQGRSLAEIQAELSGATDAALASVARLSPTPDIPTTTNGAAPAPARPRRFWAERPAVGAGPEPVAVQGFRLEPGVTLLVEGGTTADPKDILAAARPLLDLLAAGGHAPEEE
jgi:MerR HTH family regulatory protein